MTVKCMIPEPKIGFEIRTVNISESATINEVLSMAGLLAPQNGQSGIYIDGMILDSNGLDKPASHFCAGEKCFITAFHKIG